jgi:hypothetical protein
MVFTVVFADVAGGPHISARGPHMSSPLSLSPPLPPSLQRRRPHLCSGLPTPPLPLPPAAAHRGRCSPRREPPAATPHPHCAAQGAGPPSHAASQAALELRLWQQLSRVWRVSGGARACEARRQPECLGGEGDGGGLAWRRRELGSGKAGQGRTARPRSACGGGSRGGRRRPAAGAVEEGKRRRLTRARGRRGGRTDLWGPPPCQRHVSKTTVKTIRGGYLPGFRSSGTIHFWFLS